MAKDRDILLNFLKSGMSTRQLDASMGLKGTRGWVSWKVLRSNGIRDSDKGRLFLYSNPEIMKMIEQVKRGHKMEDLAASATPKKLEKYRNVFIVAGSDVAFLGLTPVDESATCPTQWNPSVSYYNNRIEEYDAIIRNLCEETGTPFIPLFDEWMEKDYSKFLEDGLHPNSEGHERIFEKVSSFLAERNLH